MTGFRIERGNATPEEIAIAIAVLTSACAPAPIDHRPQPRSRWSSPARMLRMGALPLGSGAWSLEQRTR